MYLTGGQFKGQKVIVPNDVKPTLSKVRESIFNILYQFEFSNNTFLDMFSGSGIMGLEALSRGYNVIELELNPKTVKIIKENYKKTNILPKIVQCNSLNYQTNDRYDIIYVDPPWNLDYSPIIKKGYELLSDNGIIILEYDMQRKINLDNILDNLNLNLEIFKNKKYGRCLISILRKTI